MAEKAITLAVDLELQQAEQDLTNLKKNIRSLENQLNAATRNKDLHLFNVENTEKEIATLREQFHSLFENESGNFELINPEDAEKANSLARQLEVLEGLRAREERAAIRATQEEKNVAGALAQQKEAYAQAEKKVQELNLTQEQANTSSFSSKLQSLQQSLYGVYQTSQEVTSAFSSMKGALTSSNAALGIAGATFQAFKGIIKTVINVFKSLANVVWQAGKTVVKWGTQIAKTLWTLPFTNAKQTDEATMSLKDYFKMFTKYVLGFRSFYYLWKKFRSEIQEGFENLAQYSKEVNNAISDVNSALTQLKNAAAVALAPLVTVGAPILSQFLQLCSKAANEIARITAMLTGQTSYVKANYVWEDYAESLEDASDASEKFLASFDTLEKLDNSSSSSDSTDVSEMFETVEITPFDFDSWGEALDYFLDWLNDEAIPSLKDTFENFADWLNNLMDNIVEMFTYGNNQDEIKQMAANLAGQLNDLVDKINWDTIGQALGEGINAALGWLNTFVSTFSWFDLGQSIAEGINKAVETINWKEVGQWLWDKFLIAIELLAGLITGGDTGAWAEAASDIIIAFYNDMTDTIDDVDWETIGVKIREFVEGIKWEEIGYAMQGGIEAAFNAINDMDLAGTLGSLLANIFNWAMSMLLGEDTVAKTLEDQTEEFFNGNLNAIMSQDELESALEEQNSGGLISQITSFVERFIEVFKEEFDTDKWEEVSTQIGTEIQSAIEWAWSYVAPTVLDLVTEIGKTLGKAILSGITSGMKTGITNWAASFFTEYNEMTMTDANDAGNETGEQVGNGILEGTETAVDDGASETASGVASAMTSALKSALSIHSPSQVMYDEIGVPTAEGILTALQDTFADLTTWAKENVSDPFIQDIQSSDMFSSDTWANLGKTAMTGLVDAFEDGFNSIISGLNSLMSEVSSAVSQMSSTMSLVTGSSGLVVSSSTYSRLSSISLPALAEGAVIPPNREFMAVLGDQTTGTNIETPLNTMVEAFKQALNDSDYTSSGNQTVVLEVDGTTLGSVVYSMNKKESRRIGTNLVVNR